jgi:hypothetical protein
MTLLSISSRETLEPTFIRGELPDLLNRLNVAAASNHQWALFDEPNGNGVLLSVPNMTRVRIVPGSDEIAFVGG